MSNIRVFVLAAVCGLLFASADAHAIVTKKSNPEKDIYDRPALSTSNYSKTRMESRPKDAYSRSIRAPQRPAVEPAPKKVRKKSHFSEWP